MECRKRRRLCSLFADEAHQFFPSVYEMGGCLSRNAVNTPDVVVDELKTPLVDDLLAPLDTTLEITAPSYAVRFLFSNSILTVGKEVPLWGHVALSLIKNNNIYAVKVIFNADDVMDYYIQDECLFISVDTMMDAARGKELTSFLLPCSLHFTRICVIKPKSLPSLLQRT